MESSLCVDKHTPYGADMGRFLDRGKKLPILAGAGSCAAPAGGHKQNHCGGGSRTDTGF